MNRLLKLLLAPVLVLALIGSTVFLGVVRPGAMKHLASNMTADDEIRVSVASAFVDLVVESDPGLLSALISKNRDEVDQVVAEIFAEPDQQEQVAAVIQQWVDAMLAGEAVVELDSRPLFRPIYAAIDQILPILDFSEEDLAQLDPIVLGTDGSLPDLRIVRNIGYAGVGLWILWLLLAALLVRRTGRRARQTLGWQLLTIGTVGAAIALFVPRLLASLAGDPNNQSLARVVLTSITSAGWWLGAIAAIAGALLLLRRSGERVLPSESAPDTE